MKTSLVLALLFALISPLFSQTVDQKLDNILGKLEQISPTPQENTNVEVSKLLSRDIDILWAITAAALVFFMQAGFCMLELGCSRSKNCLNVAMKNVTDFAIASISFLFVGFAIMFGSSSPVISFELTWLSELASDSKIWVFWLFQSVFVATAATIVSGAMAERTKFVGYLIHTLILSALIYPILGHWAWGGAATGLDAAFSGADGWLKQKGFSDFAGSTVVHAIGGAAALAGVIVIGPRAGRFTSNGTPRFLAGHNLPLVAIGTLILWLGWFGFNGGSTLTASSDVARIIVNTIIAGAAGGLVAMIFFWIIEGRPELMNTLNGILGGLVAITACCDVVTPMSALIIGCLAGIIGTGGAMLILKLRLDDVVGAIPVHLFNGIWGTLCVALFNENGFSGEKLGIQALGSFSISISAFFASFLVFKLMDLTIGLRASDEEQEDGLDFSEHSATAYPEFSTTEQ